MILVMLVSVINFLLFFVSTFQKQTKSES